MLEKVGEIVDLRYQVKYVLLHGFSDKDGVWHRPITYIADFVYYDKGLAGDIVEDCKGMKTDVYRLKKKLLLSRYPDINFIET